MQPNSGSTDLEAYKDWTPQAQQRALERLREVANEDWRPFYCPRQPCDGRPHDSWAWPHARSDQHPPKGDWSWWVISSGRGAGKTRTAVEWTHRLARRPIRIALVAATSADVRDVLIDGDSGLMATAPPGAKPIWEPSKRRVTWPSGAIATAFSAEEPDRLRGPQHHAAVCDEAAHYPQAQELWDMLLLGLRLGPRPRVCITTTPKPTPWFKALVKDPRAAVVRTSTYANIDNLSPVFADTVLKRYEGTRLGRQELHGEVLEDVEGAFWSWDMIEAARIEEAPSSFDRIVVAVDPAGSANRGSDETGIIVVGALGDDAYILADRSGKYSPHGWARAVHSAYEEFEADCVVAEVNFGNDMVVSNLRSSGLKARVVGVQARRGKALRAEPVVGLFEQGRAHLVGTFPALEDQMATWLPYEDKDSPDRLDAMVYGCIHATRGPATAEIASPLRLIRGGRAS